MKLFIPTIGTKLNLLEDWTFTLHEERRNIEFGKGLGLPMREAYWTIRDPGQWMVTLPKDAQLIVDRIYIRKGLNDFDSVSFRVNTHLTAIEVRRLNMPKGRFWAKLEDVNNLDVEVVP